MSTSSGSPHLFGLARQEHILDELRRSGSVRVSTLSAELGVAQLTIRRDIAALSERGLLIRVHGGATLRSDLDAREGGDDRDDETPLFRIGMVVPSETYYWPSIVDGARRAARAGGSRLAVRAATYSASDQRRQVTALLESGAVHGLIVAPETTGADGGVLLRWLASLSIPVVLVERRAPSSLALANLDWATTDHAYGGALAGEYLAELGHRRVGVVTSEGSPTSAPLRRGWDHAVAESHLVCTLDRDFELEWMPDRDRDEVIRDLLDECRATGTTALLIHSDRQAVHVQQYARSHGWLIPGDLMIVAYDDEVADRAEPPLTALRPPKHDVGRVAVELMLGRLLSSPARPHQHVYLLPELQRRAAAELRRGASREG